MPAPVVPLRPPQGETEPAMLVSTVEGRWAVWGPGEAGWQWVAEVGNSGPEDRNSRPGGWETERIFANLH